MEIRKSFEFFWRKEGAGLKPGTGLGAVAFGNESSCDRPLYAVLTYHF